MALTKSEKAERRRVADKQRHRHNLQFITGFLIRSGRRPSEAATEASHLSVGKAKRLVADIIKKQEGGY